MPLPARLRHFLRTTKRKRCFLALYFQWYSLRPGPESGLEMVFMTAPALFNMNLLRPAFLRRLGATLPLLAWLLTAAPTTTWAQSAPATVPGPANVLREITGVVGLKPRFELRATTQVANAAAVVANGQRYLLYNPQFVAAVNRAGHTDWAGISILAHEMGHHLNGHTLRPGGSQPQDELEADEFSGFVLRKLGASLAQAQAALAAVTTDEGSATHPGRTPRLAAISAGWQRAESQLVASIQQPHPSAVPVALSHPVPAATEATETEDEAETVAVTPVMPTAASSPPPLLRRCAWWASSPFATSPTGLTTSPAALPWCASTRIATTPGPPKSLAACAAPAAPIFPLYSKIASAAACSSPPAATCTTKPASAWRSWFKSIDLFPN